MSHWKGVAIVGIILIGVLVSVPMQARWITPLRPPPRGQTLRVKMRCKVHGSVPWGDITDLMFYIDNQTDLPVTILWSESTLRMPTGGLRHVVPYPRQRESTTMVLAQTSITKRIAPDSWVQQSATLEHWLSSIAIYPDSAATLSLTVETSEGTHVEKWTWNFIYIEDEQEAKTENDYNVWLTVAIAAAVLLGIVVLFPILRS